MAETLPSELIADIVVVGCGSAGCAAAVTAVDHGCSVVVLEKAAVVGGTTAKSGGAIWIPNNFNLRRQGIADTETDCLRYMCRYAFPESFRADGPTFGVDELSFARLRTFYRHASAMVDRFSSIGALQLVPYLVPGTTIAAADYAATLAENATPVGRVLWPAYESSEVFGGPSLIAQMTHWLRQHAVPILVNHRVVDVLRKGGRVSGVEVEVDGRRATVTARKAVIFASGGYAHNLELVAVHQNAFYGSCAAQSITGDFVAIASRIGAAMGNLRTAWRSQVVVEEALDNRVLQQSVFIPPGDAMILVNKYGRRVVNEKRNYNDRTHAHFHFDAVAAEYPNQILFMIFDQRGIEVYGGAYPIPKLPEATPYVIAGATLEELTANLASRLQLLSAKIGNVRLARDFAGALRATMERFNGYAMSGVDAEFQRGSDGHEAEWMNFFSRVRRGAPVSKASLPPSTMHPFTSGGPYYAILIGAGALDTSGGPSINAQAQLIDAAGDPIAGLYGAGNCIASPSREAYFGGGCTIGLAMTFGYIAAKDAAALGA